jgi:hypothetical protein
MAGSRTIRSDHGGTSHIGHFTQHEVRLPKFRVARQISKRADLTSPTWLGPFASSVLQGEAKGTAGVPRRDLSYERDVNWPTVRRVLQGCE